MVSEDSNADGTSQSGTSNNSTAHNAAAHNGAPERRGITVRRAPKFVPFMGLGAVLGIVVAAFVAYGIPGDESFDTGAVFGFFLVSFAAGGVLLGAIAALVLDQVSVRRSRRAVVESVPGPTEDDAEA
ncbi:hypothetical protein [Arthrobacter sp. FW306-2-2C-D06B]|uniref:hypothetical protein n=1 Tax=Arthrobacter sp. FW306-2-2C-D06B TaxID=2879618 RepID=UPI001F2D27FD|nr:hypothetical protein [Arthrobacter sp. FW306-2-2C-D06B]UKA58329.1 hypothetical protein LFT47_18970 [Arthrobacter sp. FW306-2-2C-D06B]